MRRRWPRPLILATKYVLCAIYCPERVLGECWVLECCAECSVLIADSYKYVAQPSWALTTTGRRKRNEMGSQGRGRWRQGA